MLSGRSSVIDHLAGVLASTLCADGFIAAVASMRVIRTAGGTAAVNARERGGATLLRILAGRVIAEADRGFAGQIDRHQDNNSAPGHSHLQVAQSGLEAGQASLAS